MMYCSQGDSYRNEYQLRKNCTQYAIMVLQILFRRVTAKVNKYSKRPDSPNQQDTLKQRSEYYRTELSEGPYGAHKMEQTQMIIQIYCSQYRLPRHQPVRNKQDPSETWLPSLSHPLQQICPSVPCLHCHCCYWSCLSQRELQHEDQSTCRSWDGPLDICHDGRN